MAVVNDLNAKLRALRDQLAVETPRAKGLQRTPPDLVRRLQAALDCASGVCMLTSVMKGAMAMTESPVVAVARGNALIQAHLALHDWERWLAAEDHDARSSAPVAANRRRHVRYETDVAVKLVRRARQGGPALPLLPSDEAVRAARDVSLGGLFVAVPANELPRVLVSSLVEVTINLGRGREFGARAEVLRRDPRGVGLRWFHDSDRVRLAIESLVATVGRAAVPR